MRIYIILFILLAFGVLSLKENIQNTRNSFVYIDQYKKYPADVRDSLQVDFHGPTVRALGLINQDAKNGDRALFFAPVNYFLDKARTQAQKLKWDIYASKTVSESDLKATSQVLFTPENMSELEKIISEYNYPNYILSTGTFTHPFQINGYNLVYKDQQNVFVYKKIINKQS